MKRKHIIMIVIGLALSLVVVVMLLSDRQPNFQGRSLTAWIDDMQESGPGTPQWLAASNAIYNIGTNAIPILMRWETARESKLRETVASTWNAHIAYEWRIRSYDERKLMAWFAFGALGEKSSPAWPVFIQWTQDKDKDIRCRGIAMLRGCRADKSVFVPIARKLLQDPDPQVQFLTARYFLDLYPDEAEVSGVYKQFPSVSPAPTGTTNTNQSPAK